MTLLDCLDWSIVTLAALALGLLLVFLLTRTGPEPGPDYIIEEVTWEDIPPEVREWIEAVAERTSRHAKNGKE